MGRTIPNLVRVPVMQAFKPPKKDIDMPHFEPAHYPSKKEYTGVDEIIEDNDDDLNTWAADQFDDTADQANVYQFGKTTVTFSKDQYERLMILLEDQKIKDFSDIYTLLEANHQQ